jgi:N-acyl-D-aspartate/D-glutamate deacylase
VIEIPEMLPKISQGVTTVIVGNCGISASPVRLKADPPDPMNLLGKREYFRYPSFGHYVSALDAACPSVNVAVLIGHTSLRNNQMDRLDRTATRGEIDAMRAELAEALAAGALGLSSGLAYASANAASTDEVMALASTLIGSRGLYVTHMRTETDAILDAMDEAFRIGRAGQSPVVISHLKCAGIANWGRSGEVLGALERARTTQRIGCDCYPYAAGSSTLDLKQVDPRVHIEITWSTPFPAVAGRTLADIASEWGLNQLEAAKRLQPAGAIYHSIHEDDMRRILAHPATMIGSDGLPWDQHPHPRLWGAFPRVLGRYCREQKLFSLPQAIHKMTSMPSRRFGLSERGAIAEGYWADLVLFNPQTVEDTATFADPIRPARGIERVWVNGTLSYTAQGITGGRAGRFIARARTEWLQ